MHMRNHCSRQLVPPKPRYLTVRATVSYSKTTEVLSYPLSPDNGKVNVPLFEGYQVSTVCPSE